MAPNFREIAKNVNFRDRYIFHGYCGAHLTSHVVAPPTILTHGVRLDVYTCKCEKKKKLEITVTRFKFQSSINLSGRPSWDTHTYRRLLTFITVCCERTYVYKYTYMSPARSLSSAIATALTSCHAHVLHST